MVKMRAEAVVVTNCGRYGVEIWSICRRLVNVGRVKWNRWYCWRRKRIYQKCTDHDGRTAKILIRMKHVRLSAMEVKPERVGASQSPTCGMERAWVLPSFSGVLGIRTRIER
jgi:hypothetical protein